MPIFEANLSLKSHMPQRRKVACKIRIFASKKAPVFKTPSKLDRVTFSTPECPPAHVCNYGLESDDSFVFKRSLRDADLRQICNACSPLQM